MGVDICFTIDKKQELCLRLYNLTKLIDEFSWQYRGSVPEFRLGKKLTLAEKKQLWQFLKFLLPKLKRKKEKELARLQGKFSEAVFGINLRIRDLIIYPKKKQPIDKKFLARLEGLTKRLENFKDYFGNDPTLLKKEIEQDYQEAIEAVKRMGRIMQLILESSGEVEIN